VAGSGEVWPGRPASLLTFGGSYPSPTIRLARGGTLAVRLANRLGESTNVHWHGLTAPAEVDGFPTDLVAPGAARDVFFPVLERAGTYWYHPHPDGRTARQVYRGMAGFVIVEDPGEESLGLPAGERDVPLLLQDRRSTADGSLAYSPTMMDVMSGYLGDAALVNGTPEAFLSVSATRYRLRLLNGANARVFRLGFSDGRTFHVIGTDGGLLESPVPAVAADLAAGERIEILADFSGMSAGSSVSLRSLAFRASGGMGMMGGGASQGAPMELLRFDVDRPGTPSVLPARPAAADLPDPATAVERRAFALEMAMPPFTGGFLVNGRAFDPDRVDFRARRETTELWEVSNPSFEPHPFHVHAARLRVLDRSSAAPSVSDLGSKDTVLVWPGETVRMAVRFGPWPGRYVLHCHNLEHDDAGMMSTFEIV
jgi:FtsP/CotA-like multicopper oxidase with cupredoxin domain